MPIKTQTWYPDTCRCSIEQTHNPDDSGYGVQLSKFLSKCVYHEGLSDEEAYAAIYGSPASEQKRKNLLYGHLISDVGLNLSDSVLEEGQSVIKLKAGVTFQWNYDDSRILNVSLGAVTSLKKTNIQAYCDLQFGIGKVIIQ